MVLYHSDDFDCATEYKSKYPGLIFIRNFETPNHVYHGEVGLDEYNKFVRKLMVPTLFEFTKEYIEDIFEQGQTTFILFYDEDRGKPDFWFTYKEAAQYNHDKIAFSWVGLKDPYAKFL